MAHRNSDLRNDRRLDSAKLGRRLRTQRTEFLRSTSDDAETSPLTWPRLHHALRDVLDLAIALTSAQAGTVQLCDADNALRLVVHRGFTVEAAQFFRLVKDDRSACHAALKRARQTVVPDVRASALYTEPARRVMLRSRLYACQSTPIRGRDGQVLGMISTHFHVRRRPTPQQLRRMTALARHAAALIEHRPQPVVVPDPNAIIEDYRMAHVGKTHAL